MRAADMPAGNSVLGSLKNGLSVLVEDGVAKLPDRTAFAGSVATADRLIRTMLEMAEVPLIECIRMISETPARIMNIQDKKGTLAHGKDADIVIFNAQIEVQQTFVMGKSIYQKS
jgi:N-acetylglucosamine-6-phosphate deacetylase